MASIRRLATETAPPGPVRRHPTGNHRGGRGLSEGGRFVDADKAGGVNGEVKERLHDCSQCSLAYFHKGDLNRHVRMVRAASEACELDTLAVPFPSLLGVYVTSTQCPLLLSVSMLTSGAESHATSGLSLVS